MLIRWAEAEKGDRVVVEVTASDREGNVELDCQATSYDPEAFVEVVNRDKSEEVKMEKYMVGRLDGVIVDVHTEGVRTEAVCGALVSRMPELGEVPPTHHEDGSEDDERNHTVAHWGGGMFGDVVKVWVSTEDNTPAQRDAAKNVCSTLQLRLSDIFAFEYRSICPSKGQCPFMTEELLWGPDKCWVHLNPLERAGESGQSAHDRLYADMVKRAENRQREGALEDICKAVMEWWATTRDLSPDGKEPEMVKLARKALALIMERCSHGSP